MRNRDWTAVLGLTLLLAAPASAQTQAGTIRVHVTVPGTQTPIPGVQLSLATPELQSGLLDLPDNEEDLLAYLTALAAARGIGPVSSNTQRPAPVTIAANGVLASTVTDLEGNAIFENVMPGKYNVRATREGYVPASEAPAAPGTISGPAIAAFAAVDAERPNADVSLFLNPGASISGRVRNPSGAPVTNARVTLGTVRLLNGQRTFISSNAFAFTNNDGVYQLPLVGPGEYALQAQLLPSPTVMVYYPGNADIERARLVVIEATRNLIEAGRNLVNVDIVMP